MFSEEYQMYVWKAGEIVPAGTYVRIDDRSYRTITLNSLGPLPATFDGHVALYSVSIEVYPELKSDKKQARVSY